jgi:hypothetical protein
VPEPTSTNTATSEESEMSTDKKLEEAAREYVENQGYEVDHDKDYWSKGEMVNLESEIKDGFLAGAKYREEMAREQASKSFEVFAWSRGLYDTCTEGEMLLLEDCYQAATLSSQKRIEELEKKLEMESEGFEEWVESEDTRMHPDGREGYFANNNNFTRDHWIAEKAWQAATLSSQKRIEELEKKLEVAVSALEKAENLIDREKSTSAGVVINDALKKIKGEDV